VGGGDLRARSGLRCHVVAEKDETTLTAEQQTALFRIFQEALTNVVRHAQGSAVRVHLSQERSGFELRVRDNGRGITQAEIAAAGSIGLLGMRERAMQAGATLHIAGFPGKGTVVIHPVVRQGIRSILTDQFRDAVVAEAGDAPSALREVDTAEWDVVLLDISMPGPSCLDLIKQLRREHPALPLLVVSE
jgi:CheY-like chemotaxis protein